MPKNRNEGSVLFSTLVKTIKRLGIILKMKAPVHMEGKKFLLQDVKRGLK